MVTDVKRRGEKMTRNINVYDHREIQTGERGVRMKNLYRAIQHGGGTIIQGDMYQHSQKVEPKMQGAM
jgi:hypothetical protein